MFHLKTAAFLANLLDNRFRLLGFSFGLDPIIGLVPWFGDLLGLFLGIYIIWIGTEMNLPREKVNRMLGNVFLDFVIGLVPVVGDFADFTFKSNSRNIKILQDHVSGVIEGHVI